MNVLKTIATTSFCFIVAAEEQPSEATQPKAARGTMAVAPLPAAEYADTEVSTNVCLVATQELSAGDNRRCFDVSLSLVATPTNNVEIAFGVDADEDGVLGCRERDFVLGWDCGAWFLRDRRANVETRFGEESLSGVERTLTWRVKVDGDHLPRSFAATDGRATLATGAATATMFSPQWNMARVVARGGVVSNERISVKMSRNAMRVIIK